MFNVTGKKAIVTGGAQGIGLAIVMCFQKAGMEVVVIDLSNEIHLLKNESNIHIVQEDLLANQGVATSFEQSLKKLNGQVDVLVNCAGLIDRHPALEASMESWNKIINLNVTVTFELARLAAVEMIKQGSGKIINMGSILSILGGFNAAAYSSSKGAVLQLTKSLSNEWAEHGIQVNVIAPGYMLTQMNSQLKSDPIRSKQIEARIPAKRWGRPEDVAGAALFLASSASDYVTGTLIPVDGGVLGR